MADTIYQGRTEKFYLNAAGAPGTDPDEVTSYTEVLYIEDWSFDGDTDVLRASHKNTSGWKSAALANKQYTITGTAYLSRDGNTGHTIAWDAFVTGTAASQKVGWIKSTNTASDNQMRGEAYISVYSHSSPSDDWVKFSFTLEGDGAPTREAVD